MPRPRPSTRRATIGRRHFRQRGRRRPLPRDRPDRRALGCRLLIVLDVRERDLRPALLLVAQVEGAGRHEHRRAVEIGGDGRGIGVEEILKFRLVGAETQRQISKRLGSNVTGRPYSALSRSVSTSSCSAPTTPTIAAAPSCGRNTCTTPSSAICCSASRSFLAFIASASLTRRRISGAKLGTPRKTISSPSESVSPMRRSP